MEFGSLADWVSAVGGTLFGALALIISIKANRKADEAQELVRVQEASKVDVWWVVSKDPLLSDDHTRDVNRWGILVKQSSHGCIYDVSLEVSMANGVSGVRKIKQLPPGVYFLESKNPKKLEMPRLYHVDNIFNYTPLINSDEYCVSFSYRDTHGTSWEKKHASCIHKS